jgi:dihydrodipicolinate synthase/N-acetylneuraminate lyase
LVKVVAGRAPVVIHVSCLSVKDTFDLAHHAQKIGADAILAITPYFWQPSPKALYDHFVRLGTSIDLPFIGYNSPGYLGGVEFTSDITRRLIEKLPNFIGMKEASFNSEKYLEISRPASLVIQGGHGHDGEADRAHTAAPAHGNERAAGLHPDPVGGVGNPARRTARVVREKFRMNIINVEAA